MGKAITEKGKMREGRGTGTGASYLPWIKIRELNSIGTATSFPDWKHGRSIELLSQAELWWYVKLRWQDDVADIREQFPLELGLTNSIARSNGIRPAQNGLKCMTSDLVVSMVDGAEFAFSVKTDRNTLKDNRRATELQFIEYRYWETKGITWRILFKEDLNPVEIRNILDVVTCYDIARVHDDFSYVRHLISHKNIIVDMAKPIEYKAIIEELKEAGEWKK